MADGVPHGQAEALHDVEHLVPLLQRDQLPRIRNLHSDCIPSAHMYMYDTQGQLYSLYTHVVFQAVSIVSLGKMHVRKMDMKLS